jgi:hypothetical protein
MDERNELVRARPPMATYATWRIRQAVQSAVAAGAYPVRVRDREVSVIELMDVCPLSRPTIGSA